MLVLALGAGVGWAVATAFAPPEEVLDARPYTTVEIVESEARSSLALNSVAQLGQIIHTAAVALAVLGTERHNAPNKELGTGHDPRHSS